MINAEGPPVPIPNTEVKLCRADNTWLATAREDKYSPTSWGQISFWPLFHSSIAQLAEHAAVNRGVAWYKSSDNGWYSWCYKVIEQSGWDKN